MGGDLIVEVVNWRSKNENLDDVIAGISTCWFLISRPKASYTELWSLELIVGSMIARYMGERSVFVGGLSFREGT